MLHLELFKNKTVIQKQSTNGKYFFTYCPFGEGVVVAAAVGVVAAVDVVAVVIVAEAVVNLDEPEEHRVADVLGAPSEMHGLSVLDALGGAISSVDRCQIAVPSKLE